MAGLLQNSPYANFNPGADPFLKRHAQRKPVTSTGLLNSPMGNFAKIIGTDLAGLAGDAIELTGGPQGVFSTSDQLASQVNADRMTTSGLLGTVAGPGPAEFKGLLGGAKALASKIGSALASDGGTGGLLTAQALFHGTPHKFDKFSLDAIGTGEGAQAYGHGLYFAENPGVASSYQSALSPKYKYTVTTKSGDKMQFGTRADADTAMEAYPGSSLSEGGGHLYEVDIPDETVSKMLDWDAPLSEQPESAQKILREMWGRARKSFPEIDPNGDPTFGQLHHLYQQHRGGNKAVISEELAAQGIPGIRFYDGNSRSAKEGTRNIVVFNPDDITQVKRDGELVHKAK